MFSSLNRKENTEDFSKYFEYTNIDKNTADILNEVYPEFVKEYYLNGKGLPSKWCINHKKQIAFILLEYTSPF